MVRALLTLSLLAMTAAEAQTWTAVTSPTTRTLRAVAFTDSVTGHVAGDSGALYKTTNAGASWTPATGVGSATLRSHFTSASTGYAVGIVFNTTDGGATWNPRGL